MCGFRCTGEIDRCVGSSVRTGAANSEKSDTWLNLPVVHQNGGSVTLAAERNKKLILVAHKHTSGDGRVKCSGRNLDAVYESV